MTADGAVPPAAGAVDATSMGMEGGFDMDVRSVGSVGASVPVSRSAPAASPEKSAAVGPTSPRDEVEISAVGKMLDDASRTPGVREERLAQIKSAIDAGTYETPEKLEMALNRMFEQISGDDK